MDKNLIKTLKNMDDKKLAEILENADKNFIEMLKKQLDIRPTSER
ncbi:hypothetical protein [Bacillus swezeyi]|nr:hypothetical protein [Bacillus swezeyi]